MKIGIISNHNLLLETLSHSLQSHNSFISVVTHKTEPQEISRFPHRDCNLIIVTTTSHSANFKSELTKLRDQNSCKKILLISNAYDPSLLRETLGRQIDGMLHKDSSISDLKQAIQSLSLGRSVIDQVYIDDLIFSSSPATQTKLTKREREILHHFGQGMNNKEVATRLGLDYRTVSTHKKNIEQKLNVHDHLHFMQTARAYYSTHDGGITDPQYSSIA